jgi:hypothetical protein
MKPIDIELIVETLRNRGFSSKDIDTEKFGNEVTWVLSEKFEIFNQIYDLMVQIEESQDDRNNESNDS